MRLDKYELGAAPDEDNLCFRRVFPSFLLNSSRQTPHNCAILDTVNKIPA